jgi:hypothetical protein
MNDTALPHLLTDGANCVHPSERLSLDPALNPRGRQSKLHTSPPTSTALHSRHLWMKMIVCIIEMCINEDKCLLIEMDLCINEMCINEDECVYKLR